MGRRLVFVGSKWVEVESFNVPEPGPGQVLVRVHRSQISGGSELGSFLSAASPDTRRPTGYTTVGRVLATGAGMEHFKPGDRVLASGNHGTHWVAGHPPGAESPTPGQRAPQPIEHDITDEQAAFGVLGGVALHGVRRAQLQIDESVAVFGQGVVG